MLNTPRQACLSECQNEAFNTLYVNETEFETIKRHISERQPNNGELHIADFGGGNGRFSDILIRSFPGSTVYNVDISQELINRNNIHPRKRIVHGSFLDFQVDKKLDIIFLNYVLHHLVSFTAKETRSLIESAFSRVRDILSDNGRLVVFENILVGLWEDRSSSIILYNVTSSKMVASLTRRLGANTAGVGVYYMGADELTGFAARQGFKLETSFCYRKPQRGPKLWPFLAKERRRQCFVFST